jgi:hypothetical protein
MSRIYLDSNVFSNLRANVLPQYQQLNKLLAEFRENCSFFFSHAHIRDKKKDLTDHKFSDFSFMEKFTQDNYLSYHAREKNTSQYLATPLMVFNDEPADDLTELKSIFQPNPDDSQEMASLKQVMINLFSISFPLTGLPENWQEGLKEKQITLLSKIIPTDGAAVSLGDLIDQQLRFYDELVTDTRLYKELRQMIDQQINNGKVTLREDGIDFNEALKDSLLQKTFRQLVFDSTQKNAEGKCEYYDFYAQAYHMLDLLGISKDKLSKKNGYLNLFNDGLHSYYAQYCDVLVTEDEGLRNKSRALFEMFDIETSVLSVTDFIALLPEIGKASEQNMFVFFENLSRDIRETERTQVDIEDGRESSMLMTARRYFNFFDFIMEVKEGDITHYFIRKIPVNHLSPPNFRESGMIVDRCINLFGMDLSQKGKFNFEIESQEMMNGKWPGRMWKVGTFILFFHRHEALKEFCMLISPVAAWESMTDM